MGNMRPGTELLNVASCSLGWVDKIVDGRSALAAEFGGNELRFACQGGEVVLCVATQPYVFMHVYVNGEHYDAITPEQSKTVKIRSDERTEISILRTAVSSGPFYVDAMVRGFELVGSAQLLPPAVPVPDTVFCTFGDSISGNCCIGADGPYDPHGLGYGYKLCERFGWQYYNTARDGSAVCCMPFDNPLAKDRVQQEVIQARPDYLLVFYGTNDLRHQDITAETFGAEYQELLGTLLEGLPNARIAVSGLLWNDMSTASEIQRYNHVIQEAATKFNLPCVQPFEVLNTDKDFDDGVHPNAIGQLKLATCFGNFFKQAWPELRD